MWSRVRRAGILTALALPCSLFAVQSAHAGLGGAPMTPPTDASVSSRVVQPGGGSGAAAQGVMRSASSAASSASSSTSASASYDVRETTSATAPWSANISPPTAPCSVSHGAVRKCRI